MQSQQDEVSDSPWRNRRPLFYAAYGILFVLSGIGFWFNGSHGSSEQPMVFSYFSESQGVLSAQVRADEAGISTDPDFVLVQGISIKAMTPTMAVTPQVLGSILGEASTPRAAAKEITHYHIEEGDTVEGLAERFGVSENTILWANDLSASSVLKPGDDLVILPVSGALHLIRPGDTASEVALWYKADLEDILDFNGVVSSEEIFVGDILIVPDGQKPNKLPNGRLTLVANSYFIYPVPRSYKITQRLHPFNAVDIANGSCGGPVYAAAGGTAQVVGYSSGFGNYVRILHPNDVVTVYAHLSGHAVKKGSRVSQGQIIGYVGHTGYTIPAGPGGCHVHFEVRGATNPFR